MWYTSPPYWYTAPLVFSDVATCTLAITVAPSWISRIAGFVPSSITWTGSLTSLLEPRGKSSMAPDWTRIRALATLLELPILYVRLPS